MCQSNRIEYRISSLFKDPEIHIGNKDVQLDYFFDIKNNPCKECLVRPACINYGWSSKSSPPGFHRYIRTRYCKKLLSFLNINELFKMWIPRIERKTKDDLNEQ